MDGQACDRHPSAMSKARILFPNLGTLYFCGHCLNAFVENYDGEFHVKYETVSV